MDAYEITYSFNLEMLMEHGDMLQYLVNIEPGMTIKQINAKHCHSRVMTELLNFIQDTHVILKFIIGFKTQMMDIQA